MCNKNILLALEMEHKTRDFEPRLYLGLKYLAKNRKAVLLIGKSIELRNILSKYVNIPFIYITKGLSPNSISMLKNFKNKGSIIISLDEEGSRNPNNKNEYLMMYHKDILPYIDYIFNWGKKQHKYIKNKLKEYSHLKIINTGNPRFDLRKPKYNIYYKNISNTPSNIILINTNFGLKKEMNTFSKYSEYVRKRYFIRFGKYKSNYHIKREWDLITKSVKYFVDLTNKISVEYPDVNIVFRPHPGVDERYFKDMLRNCKNVLVTCNGSVNEWIVNSLLMIHRDCTTAIEALINNKEIISYIPFNDYNDLLDYEKVNAGIISRNFVEVRNSIDNIINGEKIITDEQRRLKLKVIKDTISNIDYSSTDYIVKLLMKIQNNICEKRINIKYSNIWKLFDYDIYVFIQEYIRNKRNNKKDPSRDYKKFPYLRKKEIIKRAKQLKLIESEIPCISAERVGNTAYIIKSK